MDKKSRDLESMDWTLFMEQASVIELEDMIMRLNKREYNQIRYQLIKKLMSMELDSNEG